MKKPTKKQVKLVLAGFMIPVTIALISSMFNAKPLTPYALAVYEDKAEIEQYYYDKYQVAHEERCAAEQSLASAKVADYYAGLGELDKDITLLMEKIELGCEAPERDVTPNFVPVGGGLDEFLKENAHPDLKESGDTFREVASNHDLKPEILVCIAVADSNLGIHLRTSYNLGNVGNTATASHSFDSWYAGIEAIAKTLTNQYLSGYTELGQLSRGGGNETGKIYASSPYNWNKNTKLCLRDIFQDQSIDESFQFRTNQ